MFRFHVRRASPTTILTLALTSVLIVGLLAACGTSAPTKPPSSGPTIQVTPSQDLVIVAKNAPAGATLALADGTYDLTDTLSVAKDLKIEGSGAAKVTVTLGTVTTPALGKAGVTPQATAYHAVVDIAGGTFSASNVTFRYTGTTLSDVLNTYGDASVSLTDCVVTGAVKGTGADYYIGNGMRMQENATATVKNTIFQGNGNAGVAADGNNKVDISGSTFTGNQTGVIFYATAHGTLTGSTIKDNTGSGIWMGSATGGPTPTLDGNTITGNGNTAIQYSGGAAGTASNNTISGNHGSGITMVDTAHPALTGNDIHDNTGDGLQYSNQSSGTASKNQIHTNGDKGVRVVDSATPTLSDNDIFANPGDGVAFSGQSAGTLDGNQIHDNGDKGVRVLDAAAPAITNNQVTDNVGEGMAYLNTAAGTADGNTVANNGWNGMSFGGQSAPTISNNSVLDNHDCGLAMNDTSDPTFVENTVTGNGNNLCDQRALSIAPIANQCAVSDNSLNPAPGQDLAVVVEDASQQPVAGVGVSLTFLNPSGGTSYVAWGTTDANGVAVVADTVSQSWLAQGTYSGLVESGPTPSQPAIATACGNVPFPGTVTLRPDASSLSAFNLQVSDGAAATNFVQVQMGYPWGDAQVLDSGSRLATASGARVLPGDHLLGILAETASDASFTFTPTTVSSSGTSQSVDVAAQSRARVDLSMHDGSGGTGSAMLFLFRQDPNIVQPTATGITEPTAYVTPGDYWGFADLQLPDPGATGTTWSYSFDLAAQHFGPDGSSTALDVGGPVAATVRTDKASYAAGDPAYLIASVHDGSGHSLQRLSSYSASTTTGVTTMTLSPIRTPPTKHALSAQGFTYGNVTLTVTDPNGANVFSFTGTTDQIPTVKTLNLSSTAPAGTYTVTYTVDVGPYQSAPVTASTTFQVQ